jgi:hypothetical protein
VNNPSFPFALIGRANLIGFLSTQENKPGDHPPIARLWFKSLESARVYGRTSDKIATPTKALVVRFSKFSPDSFAQSALILAAE